MRNQNRVARRTVPKPTDQNKMSLSSKSSRLQIVKDMEKSPVLDEYRSEQRYFGRAVSLPLRASDSFQGLETYSTSAPSREESKVLTKNGSKPLLGTSLLSKRLLGAIRRESE